MSQAAQFPEVDVLVVDNASTDETPSLIRSYQNRHANKIDYRRNDRNIGFAAIVDTVVKSANGEYVLILSDDDALSPGVINYVLDILHKHNVMAVFLGVEVWDRALSAPVHGYRSINGPTGRLYACGADFVAAEKAFPPGCISGYVVNKASWIEGRALDFRDTLVVQVLTVLRMALHGPLYLSYVSHVRFRSENENSDKSFYHPPLGLFRHRVEPLEGLASACDGYPAWAIRFLRSNAMRTIIYHLVMDGCEGVDRKVLESRLWKANGFYDVKTVFVSVLIRLPPCLLRLCKKSMVFARDKGWL
jgi:hypothetical protein